MSVVLYALAALCAVLPAIWLTAPFAHTNDRAATAVFFVAWPIFTMLVIWGSDL